jgi:N utilization substance protein B
MINRRLIRIKTFQALYAYNNVKEKNIKQAKTELSSSIIKTLDLYFLLIKLIVDIKDKAYQKIENNKAKHLATDLDLNPNMRFVDNSFVAHLEKNKQFLSYCNAQKISWSNHNSFLEKIYQLFVESETYKKYMSTKSSFKEDKKIIVFFYEEIIGDCTEIIELLEEESIYWTEDFEFVVNAILKTIRVYKEQDDTDKILIELYKNEEDQKFSQDLLEQSINLHKENIDLIEKFTKNWEIDRIIQIDVLLMEMAITEFLKFPTIPIKVSLDEYIELSKFYSTKKSKKFINGILDKILNTLKEEGKINKKGRGLIGQV